MRLTKRSAVRTARSWVFGAASISAAVTLPSAAVSNFANLVAAWALARRCQFIRRQLAVAVVVHADEASLRRGQELILRYIAVSSRVQVLDDGLGAVVDAFNGSGRTGDIGGVNAALVLRVDA